MSWFGGSLRVVRATCRPVSVTMMCSLSSSSRPHQKAAPEALFAAAVTFVDRSVLVRASGVRQWDAGQGQCTLREKLRGERAVVRILTRRGSICFHSSFHSRAQTTVCCQLGSSAYLKAQSHHLDLYLKRLDGTLCTIRGIVEFRRSFQHNPNRKRLFQLSP